MHWKEEGKSVLKFEFVLRISFDLPPFRSKIHRKYAKDRKNTSEIPRLILLSWASLLRAPHQDL